MTFWHEPDSDQVRSMRIVNDIARRLIEQKDGGSITFAELLNETFRISLFTEVELKTIIKDMIGDHRYTALLDRIVIER